MSDQNSANEKTPPTDPPTKSTEPSLSDKVKVNAVEGKECATAFVNRAVGFDAVVKEERIKRALTFGPSAVRVARPSNILIDIYGVICSWQFAQTLKQYANAHLANHVKECWEERTMKLMMARMREQVLVDRYAGDQVPAIAPESAPLEEQKQTAAVSVQWQMEHQHPTTKQLIGRMVTDLWHKSYENGRLKTHAYPDVLDAFQYWRFEEFIKIYTYASGDASGQRLFLRASEAGDLNRYVANALNASGGSKLKSNMFRQVATALREPNLKNLLYITDCPKKASRAIEAGIRSMVVNRDRLITGKYSPELTKGLVMVNTLADIQFIYDPQRTTTCC